MKLAPLVASVVASVTMASAGCSDNQPDKLPDKHINTAAVRQETHAPVAPPPPAPPAPLTPVPEPSTTTLPADFPAECVAYAALIDKLKACDKLGGARDGLMAGYGSLRSGWSSIPADRRAGIAEQCRTQADSLRNAVAATCSL